MRAGCRVPLGQVDLFPERVQAAVIPEEAERDLVSALAELLLEAARARIEPAKRGGVDEREGHF